MWKSTANEGNAPILKLLDNMSPDRMREGGGFLGAI